MAIANIKLGKQEENLTDVNIRKVIALIEPADVNTKPITKKLACEILCISYNVKRLDTIITKFKDAEEFRNKKIKENKGKPASQEDISYTIKEYMTGTPVAQIAKALFRSAQFVNNILNKNDVPRKPRTQDYFKPELIPDTACRSTFEVGERVYSSRYDSLAVIKSLAQTNPENVYSIYLLDERWNMYAYQPASELASLEHITKLGIKL